MRRALGPRRVIGLLGTLAVLVSTGIVSAAPASASCQPGRANNGVDYHDGWVRAATGIGGVYSTILNYVPWVQPGSEVSAWTMLNNTTANWAQVGWWEYSGGTRHTFVQWSISPGVERTKWFTPEPDGTYTTYTTLYGNTAGDFTFEFGSTKDLETASFTPNDAQNEGEVGTLADQMPGGYDTSEVFKGTEAYIGGWQAFSGNVVNQDSIDFGNTTASSTETIIWDWACAN